MEKNPDGTVTVRLTAGGIDEMYWHLVTWRESVKVEQPDYLRGCLAELCVNLSRHCQIGKT